MESIIQYLRNIISRRLVIRICYYWFFFTTVFILHAFFKVSTFTAMLICAPICIIVAVFVGVEFVPKRPVQDGEVNPKLMAVIMLVLSVIAFILYLITDGHPSPDFWYRADQKRRYLVFSVGCALVSLLLLFVRKKGRPSQVDGEQSDNKKQV